MERGSDKHSPRLDDELEREDQTITRSEIGLGSAISILLFVCVVIISFVFIKLFRTDLSRVRGE